MEHIQFIQTTPQELQQQITDGVKTQLDDFLKEFKPTQPNEYLTRKDVADLLKIDLSTLHNWCKKGKLKSYGIGHRVYFIRSDIEQSLIPLNV